MKFTINYNLQLTDEVKKNKQTIINNCEGPGHAKCKLEIYLMKKHKDFNKLEVISNVKDTSDDSFKKFVDSSKPNNFPPDVGTFNNLMDIFGMK